MIKYFIELAIQHIDVINVKLKETSYILKSITYKVSKSNSLTDKKFLRDAVNFFGSQRICISVDDLSNFNDKIGIACNHFPFYKDLKKTNTKYSVLIEPFISCLSLINYSKKKS